MLVSSQLSNFIHYAQHISMEILPVFFLAILAAALFDELVPDTYVEKLFKETNFLTVVNASIIGSIIPMCTCGMIPVAYKLCKKGLSWKAIIAFLSAGNSCSIATLGLTLVLGWEITLIRFLAAISFGIAVAYFLNLFVAKDFKVTLNHKLEKKETCCANTEKTFAEKAKNVILDMKSMTLSFMPWLVVAVLLAACLHTYTGDALWQSLSLIQSQFLQPILVVLAAFPFYFCAGTDVPLSQELLSNGTSLGTVITLMTSAAGVNFTSYVVYKQCIGIKQANILIAASFFVAIMIGLLINLFAA